MVPVGKRYSGKDEQPHGSSGAMSGRVQTSIPFPRLMVLTDVQAHNDRPNTLSLPQMAHSHALHGKSDAPILSKKYMVLAGKPRHDKINVQAQDSDEGNHSHSSTLPKTTHSSTLATPRAKQFRNSGKVQSLSSVIDHPNMKGNLFPTLGQGLKSFIASN